MKNKTKTEKRTCHIVFIHRSRHECEQCWCTWWFITQIDQKVTPAFLQEHLRSLSLALTCQSHISLQLALHLPSWLIFLFSSLPNFTGKILLHLEALGWGFFSNFSCLRPLSWQPSQRFGPPRRSGPQTPALASSGVWPKAPSVPPIHGCTFRNLSYPWSTTARNQQCLHHSPHFISSSQEG